jgi:response regulator RpfG family c-di-GMP phosphodiesterase
MLENKIINVLYVDDEDENLVSFTANYRRYFNIYTALSVREAHEILSKNYIHVLITDQRMPETLGTELLVDAVKKYPNQVRILLTAYVDAEAIMIAVNNGHVFKYLLKPWDHEELKNSIIEGYDFYLKNIMKEEIIKNLELTIKELNSALKKTALP